MSGSVTLGDFYGNPFSVPKESTGTLHSVQEVGGNAVSFANPEPVQQIPCATSNGMLSVRLQSAATTNATSVKAMPGQVFGIEVGNSGFSDIWLKLYDLATAPTVGTSAIAWTIFVPQRTARHIPLDLGMPFLDGIAFSITGGAADTDATAVSANQVTGSVRYK
jgi:hypothetical protein